MISKEELWESKALRTMKQMSEERGMKFYVNPPRAVVPEFLGDWQPNAIALGPEGGIVIEVKRRASSAPQYQLAEIARKVSSQKGWEFRAIYLNPHLDETPSKPTPQQLHAAFEEIDALARHGHRAVAFVVAWAALEALARLAGADSEARGAKGLSPLQAIQALAEEGYLENDAADRLRKMARLRNAVVHGDFSVDVPTEQVESLLKELRAIASNIEAMTAP